MQDSKKMTVQSSMTATRSGLKCTCVVGGSEAGFRGGMRQLVHNDGLKVESKHPGVIRLCGRATDSFRIFRMQASTASNATLVGLRESAVAMAARKGGASSGAVRHTKIDSLWEHGVRRQLGTSLFTQAGKVVTLKDPCLLLQS